MLRQELSKTSVITVHKLLIPSTLRLQKCLALLCTAWQVIFFKSRHHYLGKSVTFNSVVANLCPHSELLLPSHSRLSSIRCTFFFFLLRCLRPLHTWCFLLSLLSLPTCCLSPLFFNNMHTHLTLACMSMERSLPPLNSQSFSDFAYSYLYVSAGMACLIIRVSYEM